MKGANSAVFERLAKFAGERDNPIPNPQAARWVHANSHADSVLKTAILHQSMSFGRFRHLAWLEVEDQHYVASVGFDCEVNDPSLAQLDDIQGFDLCLLSELPVQPRVSAIEVYDVVAANSRNDDPAYPGHDNESVTGLFPTIRVYLSTAPVSDELVWPSFLNICAEESRHGGSWIEEALASSLETLAKAYIERLPYQELCRSVLDLDPRSLFMSLYRCIEATYAHDQATKLKDHLTLDHSWNEIAAALENAMSWRPLEATSLNAVLNFAQEDDLREVCACLEVPLKENTNLASAAGKAIYQLRNRIVHYRPALVPLNFETTDWNRLCIVLLSIAADVFTSAYGHDSAA